jgi:hypothetical protein
MSLGRRLGQLHAWRDRGSVYVDGIRTSVQAGLLGTFVASSGGFTGRAWAIAFGCAIVGGLEGLKVALGRFDYRVGAMQEHQRIVGEASPVTMRQVAALERVAPRELCARCTFPTFPGHACPPAAVNVMTLR